MGSLLLALIYISFISLGLPDSLLGSAWPTLHTQFSVPVSFAGVVSMVICLGTILSSLFSDKLLSKFGAGKITAFSTMLTAIGLFGFSTSNAFWMLILWAIPYGLGAGGVDAVLNNYVALHYKPQHMSWLHCMWGVGAAISPYIMSFALLKLNGWNFGYLIVSIIQITLAAFIFLSLPAWKEKKEEKKEVTQKPLKFKEIFSIKGAIACFVTFFSYCALELTASLWASSYLVDKWFLAPEIAAGFASMFYIGITVGRFVNGFLAMKFSDHFLIRLGCGIILLGITLLLIPVNAMLSLVGFVVVGLGCAPIYPCMIHMTPDVFGKDKSQAMIGVQMSFAYVGFLSMPPLFGVIADFFTVKLLPLFLISLLTLLFSMHEILIKKTLKKRQP